VFFSEKFDPIGLLSEVGVEMMLEFGETGEIILLMPVWEVFALVGGRRIMQQ
jgi:hypothetical protein